MLALDRNYDTPREREAFARARRAETTFARQLRAIARQIGEIVETSGVVEEGEEIDYADLSRLDRNLDLYAAAITPFARTVARRMVLEVSRRDESAWRSLSRRMGRSLAEEVRSAPTGEMMKQLLEEQVDLITSLPRKAAERVHHLTTEALSNSSRAREISKEILRSGHVTATRAMLIARTEVGRTASEMTKARAVHLGSEGYVWRTAGDADVRPLHKKLDGKFIRWDDPPIAGEAGERAHAGAIYNCRCYAEPVIPD